MKYTMEGKNVPPAVIELRMKQELAIRFEHETRACSSVPMHATKSLININQQTVITFKYIF